MKEPLRGEAYQYHWPSALTKGGARETKVHSLTFGLSHRSRLIQMTRLRVDAEVVSGVLRGFQSRLESGTRPTAARDPTTRFKLALILDTFQGGALYSKTWFLPFPRPRRGTRPSERSCRCLRRAHRLKKKS